MHHNGIVKTLLTFPDIDEEERRRRILLSIFLLCGITLLLFFASLHFFNSNYLTLIIDLLASILFSICLVSLRNTKNSKLIFRIASIILITLLIYLLMSEGEDGSTLLWMYTYPVVIFLLFGKNEGLFWISIMFCIAIVVMFFPVHPHTFHYQVGTKIRFPLSFLLVSVFSYYIEAIRLRTHISLMEEEQQSQEYLNEIKTLKGFIPICASCKNIRDDQGYWTQIESYIRDHSEAEFSHSICPDCAEKLYPELVEKS